MFRELAEQQRFPLSFLLRRLDSPLWLRLVGPRLAARDS